MNKRVTFQTKPVTQAVGAFCVLMAAGAAHAGPGFGDAYDLNNNPFIIESYFASSPAGDRAWVNSQGNGTADALTGAPDGYDPKNMKAYSKAVLGLYGTKLDANGNTVSAYPGTGKALRKFVDALPLPAGHPLASLYPANAPQLSALDANGNPVAKYIPVAVAQKWVNPQGVVTNDNYFEIAVVEYTEKFHSDLKKPTTLRGYVQIDQLASNSNGAVMLPGSKAVALTYPDGSAIMINATDANGKLTGAKVQARAFDNPHYLGPVLTATRNTPTRLKFLNLLPVGRAEVSAGTRKEFDQATQSWIDVPVNIVTKRNGDLFLPVDPSIVGAGLGPDGTHEYTQNRALIHLHGGDNPWISDGTPHQWITPAGELDAANAASVAADASLDPSMLGEFTRGVGAVNVPDMNDPGPGAMTYYFPNGQSARMEWYHDHTVGMTRLNVYAGMASAYLLTDPVEQQMITDGVLPGADATIPLVLQDKTFVPDDIGLQDARWSTDAWGQPGDMWFPHVYETVQDPNQATNFNAVGRWHWGPWFWPSFPAMYALPSGSYQDVTTTPEAWMDTSLVNGVAYPTITVDPKPYRLRILNASNDRTYTFNMFQADGSVTTADGRTNTEVRMVPVGSLPTCADPASTRSDASGCFPASWAADPYGHPGGLPDPASQGPTLMQIASEGGWLPGVATKDPAPISYLLDKGRAAVLNVDYGTSGLQISNAERADVVVDFSAYAGKTLIVYNDSGAPVPAADPRNEYFTSYGDQSATGGSEDTRAGYGPNSRTLMQIKVASTIAGAPATVADLGTLDGAIKTAYASSQETPVVAQAAYNAALGTNWTDTQAFARIWTGSLKEPTFKYVPGDLTAAVFNSIVVKNSGAGYVRPPSVTLSAPAAGGTQATAVASLKIDKLHVINGGAGYRIAPTLTITSLGKGSGANATSRLRVSNVYVSAGGTGYARGDVKTVSIANGGVYTPGVTAVAVGNLIANRYPGTGALTVTFSGGGGTGATGTVQTLGTGATRRVTGITITNAGSGYTSNPTLAINGATGTVIAATFTVTRAIKAPTVSFPAPTGGSAATGTVVFDAVNGLVTGVTLTSGGAGYTSAPVPTFNGGSVVTAASATTTVGTTTTVTFAKPLGKDGTGKAGRTATGTAIVDATGKITGVAITDGGSGYTAAPGVSFTGGGTGAVATVYGSVGELVLDILDPLNPDTAGGGGYDDLSTAASEPNNLTPGMTITFQSQPAVVPAAAGFTAGIASAGASGRVFDVTLTNSGSGYGAGSPPSLTISAPASNAVLAAATTSPVATFSAATALTDTANGTPQGSALVKTKAIQELFDPTYGRLNATFGVEIPYTSALTQTTIPLGYVDQVTEEFQNGETQIWKITQNGVDTHPIHFHLLNVQLINRVGWDNFITPPEPNELGWKETVKMAPLEDVIVAVRAKKPRTGGFGLPNSVRRQDPSQPEGAMFGFTQIDPATGMPAPMANTLADYGWEYTWHCHILGHEENDFMRPVKFNANEAVPSAPTGLALDQATGVLTWTDAADTEFQYKVETSTSGTGAFVAAASTALLANSTQASVAVPPANATYRYRVTATGQAGSSSTDLTVSNLLPPAAPSLLTAAGRSGAAVTLSWTDNATNEASFSVMRSSDSGATWTQVGSVARSGASVAGTGAVTYTDNTAVSSATYQYQVIAVNLGGNSAASNSVSVAAVLPAAAPTSVAAVVTSNFGFGANNARVTVTAIDASNNESGFVVQRAPVVNGTVGTFATVSTVTRSAAQGTATGGSAVAFIDSGLAQNTTYAYRVVAVNGAFPIATPDAGSISATVLVTTGAPGAVAAASVDTSVAGRVTLSWTQAASGGTAVSYNVQRCQALTLATSCTTFANVATGLTALTWTNTGLTANARYMYRVNAVNAAGTTNGASSALAIVK